MSKWIDFSIDERRAMIQAVSQAKQIDEASAEKDWWVTAVLYAMFHTSISEYLLFKGGTSLSKGWNIINRFSEDIDLALSRDYHVPVVPLTRRYIISVKKDRTFFLESLNRSWIIS